jgi:uncharacterized protein YjbI with pentapeptide repeats
MNTAIETALITACATLLLAVFALVGALWSAKTAARQAHQDTAKTLEEQHQRTQNERFATAAGGLGSDKPAAVRLAGVYAMAGLADDWPDNRQTCIDVLCAYLRLPYATYPGSNALVKERLEFQSNREVRLTLIRIITEHLRDRKSLEGQGIGKQVASEPWRDKNFNFNGVVFDGGTFSDAKFSDGKFDFGHTKFSAGDKVSFNRAEFSGGTVRFHEAVFSGGRISFDGAKFSGSEVSFDGAKFSGSEVSFDGADFSGSKVSFDGAKFSAGEVSFKGAKFSGSAVVDFSHAADWSRPPEFDWGAGTPPTQVKERL